MSKAARRRREVSPKRVNYCNFACLAKDMVVACLLALRRGRKKKKTTTTWLPLPSPLSDTTKPLVASPHGPPQSLISRRKSNDITPPSVAPPHCPPLSLAERRKFNETTKPSVASPHCKPLSLASRRNFNDTTKPSVASPHCPPLPLASRRKFSIPEIENLEKKRWDSLESWSMLLEQGNSSKPEVAIRGQREDWNADLSQLFIGNKFASGANSRIYRAIYKQMAVAVKMIRISEEDEVTRHQLEKQFDSEVSLLSHLCHPNIVQIIAACRKPPIYCIIMEYMSQGTLRTYLHKKDPYSLSIQTILRLALDISRGMHYLHSQGVIHRDLKSDNLLLNDEMRVKVGDFGTSCLETNCQGTKCNMGTYRWMAPEMIKEKPYTNKVDVYSFGIVLWELTTALVPFQEMTPIQAAYAACEKNIRPPLSTSAPPAINNLIEKCWSVNPVKRPDFAYIVAILEKYDECVKEGLPLFPHSELRNTVPLLKRIRSRMSSTPVQA